MNKIVRETLKDLLVFFQVCHICGQGNTDAGLQHLKGYAQFEYLNEELPHIFAMSDIIVSRAGATTLFELLELKKPNLLIPLSSKASRGDQIENALYFQEQGFSKVIMEEDLEREIFLQDSTCITTGTVCTENVRLQSEKQRGKGKAILQRARVSSGCGIKSYLLNSPFTVIIETVRFVCYEETVVGILARRCGKTTLAESLLYLAGGSTSRS